MAAEKTIPGRNKCHEQDANGLVHSILNGFDLRLPFLERKLLSDFEKKWNLRQEAENLLKTLENAGHAHKYALDELKISLETSNILETPQDVKTYLLSVQNNPALLMNRDFNNLMKTRHSDPIKIMVFLNSLDRHTSESLMSNLKSFEKPEEIIRLLMEQKNTNRSKPEEFAKFLDRIPKLTSYFNKLKEVGYDASDEIKALIKGGNRERIRILSEDVENMRGYWVDRLEGDASAVHEKGLCFIKGLKGMGFSTEERIKAIDCFSKLFGVVNELYERDYDVEMPKEFKSLMKRAKESLGNQKIIDERWLVEKNYRDIFAEYSDKIAHGNGEPKNVPSNLRELYAKAMEYLNRHLEYAQIENQGFQSPIYKPEVIEQLATFLFLKSHFDISQNLELNQITFERGKIKEALRKNRRLAKENPKISPKIEPEIKQKFEEEFAEDLKAAVNRAKYEAFIETINVNWFLISMFLGNKFEKKEVSKELENALIGYINIEHNSRILGEFLKHYYSDGPETANKWVSELPGNKNIIASMETRGTNLEAVKNFSFKQSVNSNNEEITYYVENDTLKKMHLGMNFSNSCFNLRNGSHRWGIIPRAIDANNITVYAKNKKDEIISRVSLVETNIGLVVISRFYIKDEDARETYERNGWPAAIQKLAEVSGRDIRVPEKYVDNAGATEFEDHERDAFYSIFSKKGSLENVKIKIDKAVCDTIYCDAGIEVGDAEGGLFEKIHKGNLKTDGGSFRIDDLRVYTVRSR